MSSKSRYLRLIVSTPRTTYISISRDADNIYVPSNIIVMRLYFCKRVYVYQALCVPFIFSALTHTIFFFRHDANTTIVGRDDDEEQAGVTDK